MKYLSLFISLFLLANLSFAQEAGTLKWKFDTGDEIFNTPAIGADGAVYVASNDHYLYALNPDGSLKWKTDIGYGMYAAPVIGADGTIYVATAGIGKLHAINPDGTQKWESEQADGWIKGTPALLSDGSLVFATAVENFYCINPDGTTKWKVSLGWSEFSSPAVAADGTIYVGVNSKGLFAFNPDGTVKWQFKDAGGVQSSPAIGADGTIYVGSTNDNVYAVNPDGTLKWSFKTGDQVFGSPSIATDGTIYITSYDKNLYALNPDGTEKWHYTSKLFFDHSGNVTIGADNTLYFVASDTTYGFTVWLYALNPDGSFKWAFTGGDAIKNGPALADDGTLYVGSVGGTLYAVNGDNQGMANSPWPRYHHDNRGTGNVLTPTAIRKIDAAVPQTFTVSQAYPNPFNPTTHIRFSLNKASRVQVSVYNAAGQLVSRLFDGQKSAGHYQLSWNAARFGSGVYFIKVRANGVVQTRKALLLK